MFTIPRDSVLRPPHIYGRDPGIVITYHEIKTAARTRIDQPLNYLLWLSFSYPLCFTPRQKVRTVRADSNEALLMKWVFYLLIYMSRTDKATNRRKEVSNTWREFKAKPLQGQARFYHVTVKLLLSRASLKKSCNSAHTKTFDIIFQLSVSSNPSCKPYVL